MNIKVIMAVLILMAVFVTGCGKVFNPYHSEFMCPDVPKGKCATMDQAYEESFEDNELVLEKDSDCKNCDKKDTEKTVYIERKNPIYLKHQDYTYKEKLFNEISNIIDEPETPILVPPKISRILIISYTGKDDDTFFGYRYIYYITEKARFTYEPNAEAF